MEFQENVSNVAARRSNGPERSRWRDAGVDPELLQDPWTTTESVAPPQFSTEAVEALGQAVTFAVLSPALEGVQRSFDRR